ncbi:MAG: hypothetical protein JWR15_4451, partial [Prosthecobacter sp.]|nr:hypothetical protein [Prosthecobacter sp.]
MSFSFMRSTSHRPDVAHLEDEEEDEQQMPVQWSGGVRAFSHLPAQKKPWSNSTHGLSLPPMAENQVYRTPRPSLDDLGAPNFGMPAGHSDQVYRKPRPSLDDLGAPNFGMPPEPVNKPYVKPVESGRQRPFRPPEPDNDVYVKPPHHRSEDDYDLYVKPPHHRPEDDYDLYVKPPHHRPEDDYDLYKNPPNPLLDSLRHPEEDEDGDELRPPARSGMVRAFSHLPERREAEDADFDAAAAGADNYTPAGQEKDTRSWHPGHGRPEEGDDADHEQRVSDSGRSFAAPPQEPGFSHPHDEDFAKPSAQGWGQSGHAGSVATPSPSAAPGPFGGSSLRQGRLLEQRLPPGVLSGTKGPPPALFKNAAETRDAATPVPFAAKAAAPAQAAKQARPNQALTAATQGAASPPGSTALEPANRVRELDEMVPVKPEKPKKSRRSPTDDSIIRTPDEQFSREMAAYEKAKAAYEKALVTAAANHKFNHDNEQTFKAWENYDRAIQLMEKTPEGQK